MHQHSRAYKTDMTRARGRRRPVIIGGLATSTSTNNIQSRSERAKNIIQSGMASSAQMAAPRIHVALPLRAHAYIAAELDIFCRTVRDGRNLMSSFISNIHNSSALNPCHRASEPTASASRAPASPRSRSSRATRRHTQPWQLILPPRCPCTVT